MLLRSLHLSRVLSFGPDSEAVELAPLNVLIGPNGSGKSNFIEAIALLGAAPSSLAGAMRGGVQEWIWKGAGERRATIEAVVSLDRTPGNEVRHRIIFTESGLRLQIEDERIERLQRRAGTAKPFLFFGYERGRPMLSGKTGKKWEQRELRPDAIDPRLSVLAQRTEPDQYPELFALGEAYRAVRVYAEWNFGRHAPPRLSQRADLPADVLLPDASNLAMVLNGIRTDAAAKQALLEGVRRLYEGITDFDVRVHGGGVELYLVEGAGRVIPAVRLSDGTLRWLALLAVLLDPHPPRLVCIEEPELGLHPDLLPGLARLLKSASQRMQVVVTTHSTALVDAFSDAPECVLVCERHAEATTLRRLEPDRLKEWLQSYGLGELWTKGEIGGARW